MLRPLLVSVRSSAAQSLTLEPGQAVELEADRELTVDIADIGRIRVRGGNRDLLARATAAEARWLAASGPVFARNGCTTIEALSELRRQVDSVLEEATELSRQADTARLRAEGLDQLEQRVVTEQANVHCHREAIAGYLNEDEPIEELVAGVDEAPGDERALDDDIDQLQSRIDDRQKLCDRMENQLAADGRDIDARREALAAAQSRFATASKDAGDWQGLLADADPTDTRLQLELTALESELQAIRTEATAEVDAARHTLERLTERQLGAEQALQDNETKLAAAGNELARLQGRTGPLQANVEGLDLDATRAARDAASAALAAMPPVDVAMDSEVVEAEAVRAEQLVRNLESDLRKAEGALEQMGGQYLEERREQVEETIRPSTVASARSISTMAPGCCCGKRSAQRRRPGARIWAMRLWSRSAAACNRSLTAATVTSPSVPNSTPRVSTSPAGSVASGLCPWVPRNRSRYCCGWPSGKPSRRSSSSMIS